MPWQVAGYETDADKPFDQGSFGTVWHARRVSDNARVVVKLVLKDHAPDAGERIEAERRGALLQRSFHDAHGMVPAVYDIVADADGDLYIVMELVTGGALSDLIAAGPIAPTTAARHAASICLFLEKAHSFSATIEGERYDRLVHADLKPGHIFTRADGGVVVLDFGIAKALDKSKPLTTNNWGTSAYMSPERLLDGRVDEQVDFWSVGVMLFEMLAGHRPYRSLHAPSMKSQLERAIRSNAPREALPPGVPAALAAIVGKLLAYQPERRYGSAAAIARDLQWFLDEGRSLALAEYDTPATTRVVSPPTLRLTVDTSEVGPAAGTATVAAGAVPVDAHVPGLTPLPHVSGLTPEWQLAGLTPASAPASVPPTDPLPFVPPPLPPPPAAAVAPPRQRRLRRLLRVAVLIWVAFLALSELRAWFEAERFRSAIAQIDGPALASAESNYARLASAAPFDLGLTLRVRRPLRAHLLSLGDRVIADYRSDQPSLVLSDWKHAEQALRWAVRLAPRDAVSEARLLTCQAHVIRITTRPGRSDASQAAYRRAIERFRAAARLDPASFDPYLGISRVAVYGLVPADVDLAAEAMDDAGRLGYRPGRRERAQLADGYMRRAETLRREARTLSGNQRARALEKARADLQRCIDTFEPIVGYGQAARNIESCKAQRARVDDEIVAAIERAGGA